MIFIFMYSLCQFESGQVASPIFYKLCMFEIALTTFFSGHSFRKTAHLIGVPKSTVIDWVKRFKNFYLRPRQTRKTRCSKLNRLYEHVKDIVFRFVNHNPFINSELSPHESLSPTTLRRILIHCQKNCDDKDTSEKHTTR